MSVRRKSAALDRLLLFALAPPVYLVHLSLLWAIVILADPRLLVAALLLPGVLLALGVLITERRPRLRPLIWLWSALYYALCAAFAAAVLYLTHTISPALSLAYLLYAAWGGWYARSKRPGPLGWLALLLPPVVQFLWFDLRWALLLLPLLGLAAWAARRGVLERFSAAAVGFTLLGLCLLSEGGVFYLRPSFFETFVDSDPAVRPLLPEGSGIDDTNLRFAAQGCAPERLYVGGRGGDQALWLVQAGRERPLDALAGGEASDNAETLCSRDALYLGDFSRGRLLELDARDGALRRETAVEDADAPLRGVRRRHAVEEGRKPAMLTFIRADEQRNRLYAASDYSGNLIVFDLLNLRELWRLRVEGGVHHFCVDPRSGGLIMIGAGGKLFAAGPDDPRPRQVAALPGLLIFHVVRDDLSGRVLVGSFFAGKVWAFDGDTFEPAGELYLGPGVRFMADLPGRGVAVSNFFSGELTLLDPTDMRVLARTRTGRRTRALALSADGAALTTVSGRGALLIDTAGLLARSVQ